MQKDIKYIQSYILKSKNFIKLEAICIKRGEDYEKRILSALLALAMVSTCLVGCGGNKSSESKSSGKSNKDYNCSSGSGSFLYLSGCDRICRSCEKYSNNTLEFTVSGNGSLYGGDTAAGIKQLSAGSLQMLILATSVYASFDPAYNVISVPYMFDDQQQLLDYLNSDTGKDLMNKVSEKGITTVGSWTRSFRKVTNSKQPVNTPDDLKGMVLRVPNNSCM